MLPVFSRATQRALARLGESALLRGSPTTHNVSVERDVQMVDREGNVYVAQYAAVFDAADAPVFGDTLVVDGESFVIENRIDSDGYSNRFVIRKA